MTAHREAGARAGPCTGRRRPLNATPTPWRIASAILCLGSVAVAQSPSGPEECSWEVGSRRLLTFASGASAYVEPRSLSSTRNGLLLLGSPSYVWSPGHRSGAVPRDSVIGAVIDAVIDASGGARAVPAPVPGAPVRGLAAVGNEDGTWSVAFTVVRASTRFPDAEIAARIGIGSFDGWEWSNVETEPLPPDLALNPMRPSRLVRVGGTLLWSLPTRARAANAGVAVLRRVGRGWDLRIEAPSRVLGLSVAYLPAWGGVVAVARADTAGAAPRGTLRLEAVDVGGGLTSVFSIDPGEGNLWDPVFDRGRDPRWIGWLSEPPDGGDGRLEARAAPLFPTHRRKPFLILDSASVALHPIGVLDDGASYWVSHHVREEGAIRLVRTTEGRVETLFSMPTPFDGSFGAAAHGPFRILLVGPVMGRDERSPPVTTLMIELGRRCRQER